MPTLWYMLTGLLMLPGHLLGVERHMCLPWQDG